MNAPECDKCGRLIFKTPHRCDGKYSQAKIEKLKRGPKGFIYIQMSPIEAGYVIGTLRKDGDEIAVRVAAKIATEATKAWYKRG